jgi:hypothetical protein
MWQDKYGWLILRHVGRRLQWPILWHCLVTREEIYGRTSIRIAGYRSGFQPTDTQMRARLASALSSCSAHQHFIHIQDECLVPSNVLCYAVPHNQLQSLVFFQQLAMEIKRYRNVRCALTDWEQLAGLIAYSLCKNIIMEYSHVQKWMYEKALDEGKR